MKKIKIILPIIILAGIAALIYSYAQMSREQAADKTADQPVVAASSVEQGTNGGLVVNLNEKTQQLVGLKAAIVAAASLPPEIKAYGRAVDPVPLVGQLSDLASARAALDASSREYQRLKTLAPDQNVSAKTLEAAEAAMRHDQITLDAAGSQLTAGWGKAIADRPDLSVFVGSLAKLETMIVRLDVPAGEWSDETPTGAELLLPGASQPVAASFISATTTTDPQVQGKGFLFVVTNAPARLTPGLAVTGFLELPGEPLPGVVVPDAAVVRADDRTWIYVQTGDTLFARREIIPDRPVSGGWFVTNNAAPGDKVVVTGAQVLLSEERKAQMNPAD